MQPRLQSIDHLVLTLPDMGRTVRVCRNILGMEVVQLGAADAPRHFALRFGFSKIS